MPTPEEIKNLCNEYAESVKSEYVSAKLIETLVMGFYHTRLNDYCIVPKSKLQREYKKSYSAAFEHTTCLDRQYARGRYQVLRRRNEKEILLVYCRNYTRNGLLLVRC